MTCEALVSTNAILYSIKINKRAFINECIVTSLKDRLRYFKTTNMKDCLLFLDKNHIIWV